MRFRCDRMNRILHSCSCIIEFIKLIWENRDKMLGTASHLFFFPNSFNKFNNAGARMQDSIYHFYPADED